MKKLFYILSAALTISLAGCASQTPVSELLKDAMSALNDTGNAEECATQTYNLAKAALEEAQKANNLGDSETARQKARLAQTLAKQAKEEAELNAEDCERRRNAANAVTEKLEQDDFSNIPQFVPDDSFKIIYFDFDESSLSSTAIQDLQANVNVLKQKPEMQIFLAAHTDERGTTEYNLALSQRRGESVKEHATSMGIDGARMTVVPYGKEKPASIGSREQDYALNRRVEFIPR